MHLPANAVGDSGVRWVVARHAGTFAAIWGQAPAPNGATETPLCSLLAAGEMALADVVACHPVMVALRRKR
jgi:hypothetical protein